MRCSQWLEHSIWGWFTEGKGACVFHSSWEGNHDEHSDRRQTVRLRVIQADRQTDRQTNRQTDRQTDRQTVRLTDRQTGSQAESQTDRLVLHHWLVCCSADKAQLITVRTTW